MSERGIIFSPESVRGILAGRKTQTRRVVNPQPPKGAKVWHNLNTDTFDVRRCSPWYSMTCPYGSEGDALWVREAHSFTELREAMGIDDWYLVCKYKADGKERYIYECDAPLEVNFKQQPLNKPRHAMFMPRWASRILLGVVGVRVQRLQEISHEDAIQEGCAGHDWVASSPYISGPHTDAGELPVEEYRRVWDSINGEREGGIYAWDKNPFVWTVKFQVLDSVRGRLCA